MSSSPDPNGKPMFHSVNSQLNNLSRGQLPPVKAAYPVISLWKEELLALLCGLGFVILGVLGLMAGLARGPLYAVKIPVESLRGSITNLANVGALVGAATVLISVIGRRVLSGVSRAWLRRRTSIGVGPSIRQWRTLAAGVSARDARRTPFMAGGLTLAFTIAIALQNSILLGTTIPNIRDFITSYEYTNIVPFTGNGGIGLFVQCGTANPPCAQFEQIPKILEAFRDALQLNPSRSNYQTSYGFVKTEDGFLGGAIAPSLPEQVFRKAEWETPISRFTTTCTRISDVGADSSAYYYTSACQGSRRVSYGATNRMFGTFTSAIVCSKPDNSGLNIDLGVGGLLVADPNNIEARRGYGLQCTVSAVEAFGVARFESANASTVFQIQGAGYGAMRSSDLQYIGSAFWESLKEASNAEGNTTITAAWMANTIRMVGATTIFEHAISNAFAAAATFGYTATRGPGAATADYRNVLRSLPLRVYVEGYGWSNTQRMQAWSSLCIAMGVVWLSAAFYMWGGGTRYDPTDWYQTLNTSAGSTLVQRQGTCTGAHLQANSVNKEILWYGELYPGHVGFSQVQAAPIQSQEKYGKLV